MAIQQANKVKQKLKKLLIQFDKQKSGFIASQAFYQVLELHSINISTQDLNYLKQNFEKRGGFINYKEVLKFIQIDQQRSESTSKDINQIDLIWIVKKMHDRQQNASMLKDKQQNDDVVSQVSASSSHLTNVTIDPKVRDKVQQILVKDSFLSISKQKDKFDQIPEEVELQLGDDFETYNIRQQKSNPQIEGQKVKKNKTQYKQDISKTINLITVSDQQEVKANILLKKSKQIALKSDQRIIELQQIRSDAHESIITPLQPKEQPRKEGKKINMSPEKYKFNDFISHDHTNDLERLERRNNLDYPDYKSSSIMNKINQEALNNQASQRNLEQIHKTKVSPDYMKKILNTENIPDTQLEIIKKLYQEQIDFRTLNLFRDKLFDSPLNKNDELPLEEFQKIKQTNFGNKFQQVDKLILDEIKIDDQTISLLKVKDLIDLYTFHPVRFKIDKNKSHEMYFVMSSNKRGTHEHISQEDIQDQSKISFGGGTFTQVKQQTYKFQQPHLEKRLLNIMALVDAKLMEKFNNLSSAFRFFDANLNQAISYSEFYSSLDHLGIKISTEDSKKIFEHLDTDHDNAVSYNEFCELSEEKRRGIDPFRNQPQSGLGQNITKNAESFTKAQTQKEKTWERNEDKDYEENLPKNLYLSNINIDDLESISKLQSLSSLKKKYRIQKQQINYPATSQSTLQKYQTFNKTVSYGKKSDRQSESIGNVINQNYLKDYLEQKVTKLALMEQSLMNLQPKSIHNKSSQLRSQSVAMNLKLEEAEKEIEKLKINKGTRNDISFSDIHKNHHKLKKEFSLPPIKLAQNQETVEDQNQSSRRYILGRLNSNNSITSLSRNDKNKNQLNFTTLNYNDKILPSSQSLEYSSVSKSSPITKRADLLSLKALKRNEMMQQHEAVIDLVHKTRMQLVEIKEQSTGGLASSLLKGGNGYTDKPTSMTKREKEEILSNYYNAKKQLKETNNI